MLGVWTLKLLFRLGFLLGFFRADADVLDLHPRRRFRRLRGQGRTRECRGPARLLPAKGRIYCGGPIRRVVAPNPLVPLTVHLKPSGFAGASGILGSSFGAERHLMPSPFFAAIR